MNNPDIPHSLFNTTDSPLDIKGNQMLRVPLYKANGWLQYNIPLARSGNVEHMTTYSWIDKVYFSPFETEDDAAPSYSRWGARASWRSPSERSLVAVFVNNILNEIGIRQIDRTDEAENFRRSGATTNPRLYGLEVSLSFGNN